MLPSTFVAAAHKKYASLLMFRMPCIWPFLNSPNLKRTFLYVLVHPVGFESTIPGIFLNKISIKRSIRSSLEVLTAGFLLAFLIKVKAVNEIIVINQVAEFEPANHALNLLNSLLFIFLTTSLLTVSSLTSPTNPQYLTAVRIKDYWLKV
jgi:hypothetical protein